MIFGFPEFAVRLAAIGFIVYVLYRGYLLITGQIKYPRIPHYKYTWRDFDPFWWLAPGIKPTKRNEDDY